jgi:sphingolipid delta-4 desaturase
LGSIVRILSDHPEVRKLFGRDRRTALVLAGCVLAQLGLAWGVVALGAPWWAVLLLAWCVGALLNQALYAVIHETAHNLIFAWKPLNALAAILANLPFGLPMASSYRYYHLQHHLHQGEYDADPDLPSRAEVRVFGGGGFLRKLAWQLSFPFLQILRTLRLKPAPASVRRWVALNVAALVAFDVAVYVLLGPAALGYLFAGFAFTLVLHPISARYLQEHHVIEGVQETTSYYGPANAVALNVGYHNHDFPFVAWSRLPALKALAPEAYDRLLSHRSWTRLWWRFFSDGSLGIHSRVERSSGLS